jgi:dihydrofolate reductase
VSIKGEHVMRKIIVLSFLSLDGVMQGPGGPTEDPSGDFTLGGWSVPYFDDGVGKAMDEQLSKPFDLLLGRRTFEIFASYWPQHENEWPGINSKTKYVASTTLTSHEWNNTVFLKGDVVDAVKQLKQEEGPDIQVHGSGNLIQTLLKHDLIDEFWLKIFPVTLGTGRRLFAEGTLPTSYTLVETQASPSGVLIANFRRVGELKISSF